MQKTLGRFADRIYPAMRIILGAAFVQHGAQKMFGLLGGHTVPLVSWYGLAGIIELVGGLLIVVGLLTSWAAFIASGEMAVAYFFVHAPNGFWPIQNRGELALLYCLVFLFVAAHGSGGWSLDGLRRSR